MHVEGGLLLRIPSFQVQPDHRLPTLYLMDSIIKNLGGQYLQLISKNIVRLFCEAFQSLVGVVGRGNECVSWFMCRLQHYPWYMYVAWIYYQPGWSINICL